MNRTQTSTKGTIIANMIGINHVTLTDIIGITHITPSNLIGINHIEK